MTPERLKKLKQQLANYDFACKCDAEHVIKELLDEVAKLMGFLGARDKMMEELVEAEFGDDLGGKSTRSVLEGYGPPEEVVRRSPLAPWAPKPVSLGVSPEVLAKSTTLGVELDPLMGIRRAERETGRVLERRECVAILEALGPYFDVEQVLLLLAMSGVPEDKTPTPT